MSGPPPAADASRLRLIPAGVWALGLVSLFMDSSSELIHSLLPVFLVSGLGASALSLGLIEGIAEATAAVTKVFSGFLSDRLGKRKALTVAGYGLAALGKPLFPLAPAVAWVLAARFIDRIGKGIRGAPRDALLGDIAPAHLRGACFGLRQSLDTVGAFAGPLLAVVFMALLDDDIRAVFWIAVIPAVIAVAILVLGVRESSAARPEGAARTPIRWIDVRRIGPQFWRLVPVAGVLGLARFSEAFLVLRAAEAGLSVTLVPLVLVVMNAVYALSAYPAGRLSDRLGRRGLLAWGMALLIAADAVLAAGQGIATVLVGVALWGLHMGLTQGLMSTMVVDTARPELRGTAFGVFHLASGLAAFLASLIAGWLWQAYGPPTAFLTGAGFAALALAGLLAGLRNK